MAGLVHQGCPPAAWDQQLSPADQPSATACFGCCIWSFALPLLLLLLFPCAATCGAAAAAAESASAAEAPCCPVASASSALPAVPAAVLAIAGVCPSVPVAAGRAAGCWLPCSCPSCARRLRCCAKRFRAMLAHSNRTNWIIQQQGTEAT